MTSCSNRFLGYITNSQQFNGQAYIYDITSYEWVASYNPPVAKNYTLIALAFGLGAGVSFIIVALATAVFIFRKKIKTQVLKIARSKEGH